VLAAVTLAGLAVGPRYLRAAALVVNAAGVEGWPQALASWRAGEVRAGPVAIPARPGEIAARVYTPTRRPRGAIVIAPGFHPEGLKEARLVDFAGHLAARGFVVLSVELPDMLAYRISPRSTDMIEDAALWLARSGRARQGRVGIIGISFAGGLCVAAAGRPALRERVWFVLSLGGHGDLPRTLDFLFTGRLPDGTRRRPHDYGVCVALLALAGEVVPPTQVKPLTDGVLAFLDGSRLAGTDTAEAAACFARAVRMERALPEPSARLMRYVNTRDVDALGRVLSPQVSALAADPALSPERSPAPAAPVYLLHGEDDDVIPASESRLLAAHLRGRTRVRLLVTPVLRHADVERRPHAREAWRLVSFWAAAMDE
jgi:dienelactone hydrolase